jgi:hypothetical protein
LFISFFFSCSPLKKYEETANVFEKDILILEELDFQNKADKNNLLFVGSSSVRLWNNIENDMYPYKSVKRGYGGAHYYDLIHFIERLVINHSPKAILIFVANDITGSNDISPEEVKKLFKYCYKVIRKIHKKIPVFVIETTPTTSRWNVWNKTSEANDLINSYCDSNSNLYFINTRSKFVGKNGLPIKSLFISDELHLSKSGYKIWSDIIKEKLIENNIF